MTTCENYGVYSHPQIRHEMYDGAGPSSQGDAMAGWRELAGRLSTIRHYLDSAISGVQGSQQGAAADAAVGAMVPLGTWVDEAQRLANDTRDRIDYQISGFTTARNSVPEVPPEPRGGGWQDLPVIDSFTTSDQEADEAFNAEQEQQARAAMMAYQNGTNERVVSVAQFAPPPTGEPDLTIPTGNRSAIGALPGGVGGGSGAGSAVPGSPTPSAGVGSAAPVDLPAAAPAPTGPQGGGGTGGSEYPGGRPAPAAPIVPGGVVPGTPAVTGPSGAGRDRVGAGRDGPGSAGRGGPGSAGGMGGGPVTGGFGPSGGRGAGVGRFGPERGAGGFGPERGAGGFGPAGSPDAAARGAGAASAGRGTATAGGMAPFGGLGGSRGGEDTERQRPSYLIEPDSNRLIGELPRTAPPVIGEDPPDYDEPSRR